MFSKDQQAYLFLILTTLFWAGNFIVGEQASRFDITPFTSPGIFTVGIHYTDCGGNFAYGIAVDNIKIPIQGGLDPKILLTNKKKVKIEAQRYLDIFKNHPYIFNLGHGVLPEIKPETIGYIIELVRNK